MGCWSQFYTQAAGLKLYTITIPHYTLTQTHYYIVMAWILYTGTSRALYTGNTPSGAWRGDTYPVSLFSHHEDHDDGVCEDYDYFDDQNDDLEDHDDLPVN